MHGTSHLLQTLVLISTTKIFSLQSHMHEKSRRSPVQVNQTLLQTISYQHIRSCSGRMWREHHKGKKNHRPKKSIASSLKVAQNENVFPILRPTMVPGAHMYVSALRMGTIVCTAAIHIQYTLHTHALFGRYNGWHPNSTCVDCNCLKKTRSPYSSSSFEKA